MGILHWWWGLYTEDKLYFYKNIPKQNMANNNMESRNGGYRLFVHVVALRHLIEFPRGISAQYCC